MPSSIRISEAASLALHTLAFLFAHRERPVTTKEIAGMLKCSESHLAKVLQRLVKDGYVRASRGPKGGFVAVAEREQTSALQVIECVDGAVHWNHCLFEEYKCPRGKCLMKPFLEQVDKMVMEYLSATTLRDLAEECRDILVLEQAPG